ncbi:MAG TPA: 4a-hydroxytetrahydrobiopterin dehydratase [Nocardioidaceae bacterium]|nr:4a-hydroxytetrahydrobiopterin dehydratase [Nocardioidaceae bacterium]
MTDPLEKLTATQVREAGLTDWRQILGRIKARFRTGDFATGLALANKIGEAAEAANHHPDIQLSYTDVIVTLSSHDVHGITSRDLDLARQISTFAAELEIDSDVAGLTQLELGLDTARGSGLAPFYAALLGGTVDQGEPVDPSGQVPTVWWQDPTEVDEDLALPEQPFEQRWHFDVWVPHDEAERRLQAVLDAGGRLVSDRAAPAYWVVEDADGNRSCICTTAGR